MALAYSEKTTMQFVGNRRQIECTVTFDNSYATGGEPISLASLGLGFADKVDVVNPGQGYLVRWDRSRTAPKLVVYQGDNANAAAAPGTQVPNATDLSTLVCGIRVTGR